MYNKEESNYKQLLFNKEVNRHFNKFDLLEFHENGTNYEPNLMKYINENSSIETISITQVESVHNYATMTYKNIFTQTIKLMAIEFTLNEIII